MGGSAKQVRDKVAKETGYTGSDLDKAGQHVAKKGGEVVEGFKEHGGAMATGLGQGLGKLGTTAMAGLKHNLDQVGNIFTGGGGGGGEEGETTSAANYSASSKKGKAAGSAEGRMGKKRERLAKRDALKVRK
tara:strand:- start:292 stop:687 length:396 start_codon:yes stop_codon:yes gene_type:complete